MNAFGKLGFEKSTSSNPERAQRVKQPKYQRYVCLVIALALLGMPSRMFSFSDTWVFRNSLSGVYMWFINKVCRMVSLKTLFLLPFKKIAELFISGKFKSTSSGATQSRPPVLTFSFQTQQCITTASTPIS